MCRHRREYLNSSKVFQPSRASWPLQTEPAAWSSVLFLNAHSARDSKSVDLTESSSSDAPGRWELKEQ